MKRLPPQAELIAVGDELLSGRIADTNSAFVGRMLAGRGLRLLRTTHIPDSPSRIGEELTAALARAGLVIVTGGLGPTEDDRTLDAVAQALDCGVSVDRQTLSRVKAFFRRRGTRMPTIAARQARVLTAARLLRNPVGMVPGMLLERVGRTILLLPGVPAEMQALLPAALEDAAGRFRLERWHSVTVRTYGLAEAAVAEAIGPALSRHPDVSPAYYPSTSGVDVVLTSTRKSEVRSCATSAGRVLGNAVYEVGDRTLERVVGEMLKERGLRVATAESCTGGLIAARLTDVPGSSDYLAGGVVAYSNSVKSGVLEVATDTLRLHGAVSMPVAAEMASGACEVLDSDVGIAVTGIAGPGGATRSKPVGLVFAAVAMGRQVRVERRLYSGTRQMIRERSASAALDLCRRVLGESK